MVMVVKVVVVEEAVMGVGVVEEAVEQLVEVNKEGRAELAELVVQVLVNRHYNF
jgi:hypothetical protein